jgi:type II secretory ATPase GspE/PulE/Tfp pilus assembly ATPase PilB-like protein/CheY-like chemotaxis protein
MSSRKPLILCIDDDAEMLFALKRWLSDAGFIVATAQSYNAAVKSIAAGAPDLILQDALMPEMSGFECCRQLQADDRLSNVPVVFLTALAGEKDRAQALAAGGVDFLIKPVQREKLIRTVQRHLATRAQWAAHLPEHPSQIVDLRGFLEFLLNALRIPPQERSKFQGFTPGKLYAMAPDLGLEPAQIARHMAAFARVPYAHSIDASEVELGALPAAFCRTHQVLPLNNKTMGRYFAVSNALDLPLFSDLKNLFGEKPKIVATEPANIDAVLTLTVCNPAATPPAPPAGASQRAEKAVRTGPVTMQQLENRLSEMYSETPAVETVLTEDISEESAPVIQTVNKLINDAIEAAASDIHIEPCEHEVVVRYRIDGELRVVHRLKPQKLCLPLAARIKIMSNLDITEKRLPQDGRIVFNEGVDLRVASCPMNFGEKIVMRILDKKKAALPLDALGFSDRNLETYREKIKTPYGMILHVGPTGSGKSMSLFSALREIQRPDINIQTIEDPIEYTLPGINQMQTHADIGLTFQRALRSYLRQDPDVILVGEIRDRETANAAVEASLTGHMLFSTLHTNDAAATVVRLMEMGVEPYLVSSSLVMVCAQRLIRRLCEKCKETYEPNAGEKTLAGIPVDQPQKLFRAKGCSHCQGTGYKGRVGVHELLVLDDTLRALLARKGLTSDELKQKAVESAGMTTLYWDAMEKARLGVTTVEEVIANVKRDDFDSRPKWMLDEIRTQTTSMNQTKVSSKRTSRRISAQMEKLDIK